MFLVPDVNEISFKQKILKKAIFTVPPVVLHGFIELNTEFE